MVDFWKVLLEVRARWFIGPKTRNRFLKFLEAFEIASLFIKALGLLELLLSLYN